MGGFHASDTFSGNAGKAYAKINGNNEELFFAKSISTTVSKSKGTVTPIGRRMKGHKTTGAEGTGTMTIYYMTPIFREALQEWKRTGKDMYFDMVLTNDDPSSAAKEQSVLLIDCNLDEVILAQLDGSSEDPLEEESPFTFEDFDILTPFKKI